MKNPNLLPVLTQVAASFFDQTDRKKMVGRILDASIELTEGDRGAVFLKSEDGDDTLTTLIATGLGKEQEIKVKADQGIVGHVFRSGMPINILDAQKDPRFNAQVDASTQYKTQSILCCPLRTPQGEALGVIEILNSKGGTFSDEDMQVLQILALFAAVALSQSDRIQSLREANQILREQQASRSGFFLDSKHPILHELYKKLSVYGESDSNILIEGESGTGKEVVARSLHEHSARSDGPFIAINCAAIPESLFEAELFGVAKGAATGTTARKGQVELADGGTLFLDEIGELPLSMQVKLLRVLQDHTVVRVGSEDAPKKVDFRLISATNRQLQEMVKKESFREDLFYRVNVVGIQLPPLRDRKSDIEHLIKVFSAQFLRERGWPVKKISPAAHQSLLSYDWPGNIRQLQNKLEGAMIASGGRARLEPEDFQLESSTLSAGPAVIDDVFKLGDQGLNLRAGKRAVERYLIEQALTKSLGNKSNAAKLLGISREGLRKAMEKIAF